MTSAALAPTPLTGPLPEEVKGLLREKAAAQGDDVVLPKIEVGFLADERLVVRCGAQPWRQVSLAQVNSMLDDRAELLGSPATAGRAEIIGLRTSDPLRYGWEPEAMRECDLLMARKRLEHPGVVLELLLTGGIRSAKTENAVKRVMSSFCYTERSRVWGLHETEKTSKLIHQRRFYKFIPPEMKPKDSTGMETGKGRRTIGSNFSYTEATGFPPNLFLLYWKCFDEHDRPFRGGGLVDFQFYKSDDSTKQGEELTVATSDELVPKSTCETVRQRLLTRAQDTRNPVFLERIRQAIRVLESGRALPPALRGLIYHSVHIITFTPKEGYSPTVAEFLDGATTIKETTTHVVPPGALGLPEDWKQQMLAKGNPELLPGKTVPLFKQPRKSTRLVCYLHTWMNPFGGNWPGLVEDCAGRSDEYIRIHAFRYSNTS